MSLFDKTEPDFTFTAYGHPVTAGSKRAFRSKSGRMIVTDDNPAQKGWQNNVSDAAMRVVDEEGWEFVRDTPLAVGMTFYLSRPKGHFGTGRNAGVLKDSAQAFPAKKPDTMKLVRAVEDALSGVLWRDDALIVDSRGVKLYGEPERVEVRVRLLTATAGELSTLRLIPA